MISSLGGRSPMVAEGVFVASTATVIGAVTLKRYASVWYGAVLRGDIAPIVVGEGSNVQDNAVLHTDVDQPLEIGTGVTVGHNATLHGCCIGDDALIGMGATLLNSCSIAYGAVVAAQTLVPERYVVAARQLVRGVPARDGGLVDDHHLRRVKDNASLYRRLALEHQHVSYLPTGKLFKLVVFVPIEEESQVKNSLFRAGAGTLGDYTGCSWQVAGSGNFQPQAGSNPTVGQWGEVCRVEELRLETLVKGERVAAVLEALLACHPYESPAFDLVPVYTATG